MIARRALLKAENASIGNRVDSDNSHRRLLRKNHAEKILAAAKNANSCAIETHGSLLAVLVRAWLGKRGEARLQLLARG
jgi:hypothetical protein